MKVTLLISTLLLIQNCQTQSSQSEALARSVKPGAWGFNVLTYNSHAKKAAEKILQEGGNAFDAFVAAAFVEYVTWPGTVSLGGPLTALIHRPDQAKVLHLDGAFNLPANPSALWQAGKPTAMAMLIPGAPKALQQLNKKFGSMPFEKLTLPAIELAENGFRVSQYYSAIITARQAILKTSQYGKETFFRDGVPLQPDDIVVQKPLAALLKKVSKNPDEMYSGDWAKACVQAINEAGGALSLEDFASYESILRDALTVEVGGYSLAVPKTSGGLGNLISLKLFEFDPPSSPEHYTENLDDIDKLIHFSEYGRWYGWTYTMDQMNDEGFMANLLSPESIKGMHEWISANWRQNVGGTGTNHSSHLIVRDRWNNVITGTITINSLPWASGVFVDGVAVNDSGKYFSSHYQPGERVRPSRVMSIGRKDGLLQFASGAFNRSLNAANLQFLINLLHYRLDLEQIVTKPRFGIKWNDKLFLDKRIGQAIRSGLQERGHALNTDDHPDTGLGGVLLRVGNDFQSRYADFFSAVVGESPDLF